MEIGYSLNGAAIWKLGSFDLGETLRADAQSDDDSARANRRALIVLGVIVGAVVVALIVARINDDNEVTCQQQQYC